MKKIHDVLIENLSDINSAGYMKDLLRQYNLYIIFSPLYENYENPKDADFLCAFIILSYT